MRDSRFSCYFSGIKWLGEWKGQEYVLGIIILVVGVITTIYGAVAYSNSETSKDTKRYLLAQLLLFAFLLTRLSIIMITR